MKVVVALGGNALLRRDQPPTAENQLANIRRAAAQLARVAANHDLVLTHGNGPQVGLLALQAAAYIDVEAYPLDVLGAQTDGMIGYLLEQELANLLPATRAITTLITRVPITFTTAALGGCVEIPDLDGSTNRLDIPAGIQSGKQLRVRGAGMPVLQGRGRGDLVVEIAVETPTKLSRRQKEILEEFRATETGDECPESRGFFDKLKDVFGS